MVNSCNNKSILGVAVIAILYIVNLSLLCKQCMDTYPMQKACCGTSPIPLEHPLQHLTYAFKMNALHIMNFFQIKNWDFHPK